MKMVSYLRNTAERKRAEDELRASRDYLESLINYANAPIIVWDPQFLITRFNHAFEAITGRTETEVIGRPLQILFPPNLAEVSMELVRKAMEGEIWEVIEIPILHRDGSIRTIIWNSATIFSQDGKTAVSTIVQGQDITERKLTEEALSVSEIRYRRLFETAQDGILILDADTGMIVDVNPFLIEMLGYSHEQFIGKTVWELGPLKDFIPNRDNFMQLQRQEYIRYEDLPLETSAGCRINVEFVSNVYLVDHKKVIQCNIRDITERRRAEEALENYQTDLERIVDERTKALRESEKNFRRSLDDSPLGIRIITADGELLYANQAILDIYGYDSIEELKTIPHKKNYTPESYAEHKVRIGKRQRGEYVPPSYEISVIRKDGEVRHLEVFRKEVLWNGEKQFQVLCNDITERKRAEEALRASESNLAEAQRIAHIGSWEWDMILDTVKWSKELYRIFDISPDAYDGNPESLIKVIYPDDVEIFINSININLSIGDSPSLEYRVIHKDGSIHNILATGRMEVDEAGKPIRNIGTAQDITERKRAEEALRESEKKYRQLIETLQEGIWSIDKDDNTTFVNSCMAGMLGYTVEEMLGKSLFNFMDERGVKLAKYSMERRRQGIAEQHDFEFLRKDGKRIYATLETSPLMDTEGNYAGALAGVIDITERKLAEDRRLELERKYLISSRLASIGEMAAGIAHEINNPLSPIIGFADLLLKEDLPETVKSDLQIIRDCANRAANVTKGLLVFARQSKPMRKLYSINEVVETTIKLRAYHLKTNNIKVIKELDPELPETMVDAAQMQQVLLNLIMNAEYEMKKARGGGNLTVKTEKKDNIIRILVKDDGQGISGENMEKLFQPFFTTKNVGEGTGLGLSVCHGIVAEHNGRIYAESKEGAGATFTVELPIVRQDEGKETEPSEPDAVKAKEAVAARILVIDDEPQIIQILQRVLTAEGYAVEATVTAKEALKLIEEGNRYALILLDIRMPDMSGIELYQHLDKTFGSLTKRIIFITGDVLGTDTMDFFSLTRVSYITKPFDVEHLKKEIKNKLTQRV